MRTDVDTDNINNNSSPARFTIGEAVSALSEEFPDLSVSKVRYLERRGLLHLERTKGGYRIFKQEDIDLLRLVLSLQENEYLPLEVIKQHLDDGTIQETRQGERQRSKNIAEPYSGAREVEGEGHSSSYTKEELCNLLEADTRFIEELISAGVIGRDGDKKHLNSRDAEVTQMAVEMSKYGIRPRHLRGIVAAVEREVAMFKQVLNPELRSGDERRVSEALESAHHLASIDSRLKNLIMSESINSLVSR